MTDEWALYQRNYPRWAEQTAASMAEALGRYDDAETLRRWRSIEPERIKQVWAAMDPELQARIRRLADANPK